jgi:hypothetical protein
MIGTVYPPPPPPPLSRLVREDARPGHNCPKCGSSMSRKWWIFGALKCIHPECGCGIGTEKK